MDPRAPVDEPAAGVSSAQHWDGVYAANRDEDTSWFQPEPTVSLRLLTSYAAPPTSVVDVGAGRSRLADRLVAAGWTDLTMLDVSAAALAETAKRLDGRVHVVVTDLLGWRPERTFGAWHDRAVFHFLTAPADRACYVAVAEQATTPGGVLIIGTFAADGPTSCSGLPTARYSADGLAAAFGPLFALEHAELEEHVTPWGAAQPFTWAVLRRLAR